MEKHELVDINGNKTGKVLTHIEVRNEDNIPNGCYISVVGVVILNKDNEVLLQKRSRFKRVNPSKWGICGGKVDFNETTLEAGMRETLEEIGVNLKKENLKFLSMATDGKAHFTVYYIKQDIDVNECKLQEEELEEVKYFKIEELQYLDNEGFEWLNSLKKIILLETLKFKLDDFKKKLGPNYKYEFTEELDILIYKEKWWKNGKYIHYEFLKKEENSSKIIYTLEIHYGRKDNNRERFIEIMKKFEVNRIFEFNYATSNIDFDKMLESMENLINNTTSNIENFILENDNL